MGVPSISAQPNVAPKYKYEKELDDKTLVFAGYGNLYGFFGEEANDTNDIFMCFYDAAETADVDITSDDPVFTWRVPKGGSSGKDANDTPFYHFKKGCVVCFKTSRSPANDLETGNTGHFWSESNTFTIT